MSQVTDGAYVVETPRPQSLTLTETLSLDERLRWEVTTPGDCGDVKDKVPGRGSRKPTHRYTRPRAACKGPLASVFWQS